MMLNWHHYIFTKMFSKFACGFTVVIPFLLTLQLHNITKRALADKTQTCGNGLYNEGGVCKECPAGFFGTNCSAECPALFYVIGCLQNCDCSPCHHVYGCVSSTLITAGIIYRPLTNINKRQELNRQKMFYLGKL